MHDALDHLGITVNESLTWGTEINNIIRKCNATLSNLFPIKNVFNVQSKTLFINAFILSKLNYCSLLWLNTTVSNRKAIDRIQKKAVRFIYKKEKRELPEE